jgi:uncharacterized protein
MKTTEEIIEQTKKWITEVVIGCNFCPFASKEVKQNSIHYQVERSVDKAECLQAFLNECAKLDEDDTIATTLLIFPNAFQQFDDYLDLLADAEALLEENDYEGIYQVASFHPQYIFGNAPVNDAANYTNRSVYPMLHLLREEQIDQALERYPNPEKIPNNNINFAREKGVQYMKMLRDNCL